MEAATTSLQHHTCSLHLRAQLENTGAGRQVQCTSVARRVVGWVHSCCMVKTSAACQPTAASHPLPACPPAPHLSRLSTPTPPSACSTQPAHNVPPTTLRTREKINRPQTRRRRDNSEELLDKLRLLKDNLVSARAIMDEVVRRERRKRDLAVSCLLHTIVLVCCMCCPGHRHGVFGCVSAWCCF